MSTTNAAISYQHGIAKSVKLEARARLRCLEGDTIERGYSSRWAKSSEEEVSLILAAFHSLCRLLTLIKNLCGKFSGRVVPINPIESVPELAVIDRQSRDRHSMHDFNERLAVCLAALRAATEQQFSPCEQLLLRHLSESECHALRFANSLPQSAGSWYRPFHNLVVTAAMVGICESQGAARDLVLAAILHDIGYSFLELSDTLSGASWSGEDIRVRHMRLGVKESRSYLTQRVGEGALALSSDRLEELLEIIGTHDNPYLGKPLTTAEALVHRDADRTYVLSCSSFWKDYVAYAAERIRDAANTFDLRQLTPDELLAGRHASFFVNQESAACYGLIFEPMNTAYAKHLAEVQYQERLSEIPQVMQMINEFAGSAKQLQEFFASSLEREFTRLCKE